MDGSDPKSPGPPGEAPRREPLHVSIVMPALNEEKDLEAAVRSTLAGFEAFSLRGEVIVINDGSLDRTGSIAEALAAQTPLVRVVHHAMPQGIGAAFWEGVDLARGNAVCMLPGDNENDPEEIFRYASLLEHVDLVIPFVFNKESRSLFRNALSMLYRFIINTTFLVHLHYTNGTVLYRKGLLDALTVRSNGFFFQTDILVRSLKRGYLFAEVPYRLRQRRGGRSKAVSFPSFVNVAKGYLRLIRDLYALRRGRPEDTGFASGSATERRRGEDPADPGP